MLYVDRCGGLQVTELVLVAHSAPADALVRCAAGARWELPPPFVLPRGVRRYADRSGRDLTGVPRIEVSVQLDPGQPIVAASHRHCVMRLRRPLGDAPSRPGVRIATIEECVELGLRWCLGVGRLGCFDPVRTIFPGSIADAEAWVVEPRAIDKTAAPGRSCVGNVQIWKGRLPARSDVAAVSRMLGSGDADAWQVAGDRRAPTVLVATLVSVAGPAPVRPPPLPRHWWLLE